MKSEFPSKHYFELVKTKEDYLLLLSTGLGYEVEPNLPNSWDEHLRMIEKLHRQQELAWQSMHEQFADEELAQTYSSEMGTTYG